MGRCIAAVLVVSTVFVDALWAQQNEPPRFRAVADAIEVDVSVVDRQGNPVTDLTIDEFELLENGVPQKIDLSTLVQIQTRAIERLTTAVESDVATNAAVRGRLYIIALDEVSPALALRARDVLKRFLDQHFAPGDVGAVVHVGRGESGATQDFTMNRRLLAQAIDKYSGGFPGDTLSSRERMRQLRLLLEYAGRLPGRKAMLYVTQRVGDVNAVLDYSGGTRSSEFDDLHAAMTAATRGNVSIYPIDPAGLPAAGPLGEQASAPNAEVLRLARTGSMERTMELRALAAATGGISMVNTNNFEAAFERAVRDLSVYYVLGFTSSDSRRDGRYRRVQVRVTRPGLEVRTRNGYLAPLPLSTDDPVSPQGAERSAVTDALRLPVMSTTVPMRAVATPYLGRGRQAYIAVAVEVDVSGLELVERAAARTGVVQVTAVAFDTSGRRITRNYRVEMALKPYTYVRAQTHGLRILADIEVPPGHYQLRIAAGNVDGRGAGSVVYDLEVPDFMKQAVVMSGVMLTADSAHDPVTAAQTTRPIQTRLPAPPTAVRTFDRGDAVTLYGEVYDNRRRGETDMITLHADLRARDGGIVQSASVESTSDTLTGASAGQGFRARLPLDVMPGDYIVHTEARTKQDGPIAASRDITIRVR